MGSMKNDSQTCSTRISSTARDYLCRLAIAILITVLVWNSGHLFLPHINLSKDQSPRWHWHDIAPTRNIRWHQCYEDFDCARLDVPLDWQDPSDDSRAYIAIIRYNATNREDYRGPVFINPGGPGGSGVWFVRSLAPYYQAVVGRNHDIIGFDPRGVGATIPRIDCWAGSQRNARAWDFSETPVIDAHPGIIYDAYARSVAFSNQCADVIGSGSETTTSSWSHSEQKFVKVAPGRFVTTASVARDMLEIMSRLGESKLKYWGFSYGTVLGTTFASMFPDRVDRIVNDGNVDVEEWTSGYGLHYADDSDKVMDAFYRYCHLAGSSDCSFYSPTPAAIETRLSSLLEKVKKNPVVVPPSPSSDNRPSIVSFSDIRRLINSACYRPLVMFPPLARALAALESGDGSPFLKLAIIDTRDPFACEMIDKPRNGADEDVDIPDAEVTSDAFVAIMCSDSEPMTDSADEFQLYAKRVASISSAVGMTMAQNFRLRCAHWNVRPKWRFAGPFGGNTSSPILFIANQADNVTPLRSAQQNAAHFPGSVILVQNSYGHTTLSTPSRCTVDAINAYFQRGELPAPETSCDPDLVPFEHWNVTDLAVGRDADLDSALHHLMMAPVVLPNGAGGGVKRI